MRLIWTKSKLPLSVMIRWLSKEPCSHFAIVFDEDLGGVVFHSNLMGSHIEWFPEFSKHLEIVHSIEYLVPLELQEEVYQRILQKYYGRSYDWKAFFKMIGSGILFRFFKIPLPKKIKGSNGLLCTELIQALPEWILPKNQQLIEDEILTPEQSYIRIMEGTKNG